MKDAIAFWSSNLASNLSHLLYSILLLLLPVQLGKHFWPSFSFVDGIRVDFLAVILYLSDIIFLGFFLVSFPLLFRLSKKTLLLIGIIFLYLFLVSLFSVSPVNSFYGLFRLSGYIFFGFVTALYLKDRHFLKKTVVIFSLTTSVVSVLALLQFLFQHSIGGLFYFLGERTFSTVTPGIANASLEGNLILRPYATFPHPNVLAGFLGISLTVLLFLRELFVKESLKKNLITISFFLGISALFLTMSRTALFAFFLILLFWFLEKKQRPFTKGFFILLGVIVVLFLTGGIYRFTSLSLSDEAVMLRIEQINQAWKSFLSAPLFGVGYKNYLVSLSGRETSLIAVRFLQPVHNVFLLFFTEAGIIGVIGFITGIFFLVKKMLLRRNTLVISLLLFLFITSLTDHYWYTLHQGQLLAAFVLGFVFTPLGRRT